MQKICLGFSLLKACLTKLKLNLKRFFTKKGVIWHLSQPQGSFITRSIKAN